jgi:chaperonin cofactor prefoldin
MKDHAFGYYFHIEFIVQTSHEAFGVDSHIVQWPEEEEVYRHVGELLFQDHPLL